MAKDFYDKEGYIIIKRTKRSKKKEAKKNKRNKRKNKKSIKHMEKNLLELQVYTDNTRCKKSDYYDKLDAMDDILEKFLITLGVKCMGVVDKVREELVKIIDDIPWKQIFDKSFDILCTIIKTVYV